MKNKLRFAIIVPAIVLAIAALLTACGSSSKSTPSAVAPAPTSSAATAAPPSNEATTAAVTAAPTSSAATAEAVKVTIKDFAFKPQDLKVKLGTKVTWTNEDTAPHTATQTSGPAKFDSGTLNTGQSFSYTFTKPGTYHYYCSIHNYMTATVTVS